MELNEAPSPSAPHPEITEEQFREVIYQLLEQNRLNGVNAKKLFLYRFRKEWRDYFAIADFLSNNL